jgi:PTS system nitrogen regulatory IIA component
MAGALNLEGDGVDEAGMLSALWTREQRQNTALDGGVALSATVVPGLGTTQLGVFKLERPVDYDSLGRDKIDVVLAVLAPPQQRRDQLWLIDRLHEMIRRTSLTQDLRAASDVDGLHAALEAAETAIEALESDA